VTAASRSVAALSGGPLLLAVVFAALFAACGSQSTTPPGPTRPPTARLSAEPAASSSPGPAASRDPGEAATTKFFVFATDKKFAYQATFTGEERQTVNVLPISKGLLQVNGADVRVVATFTYSATDRIAVEHRAVGGRGWLRFGANAWQRLTRFGAAQSMAAFAAVHAPPDVVYGGPVTTGGKTVYRVSMKSVIVNPIMIPFINLSDVAVTDSKLQLLIDAAGRPLSGTATITGRGRISGQLQEIVIDLKLTFLKVGQKVTISAP
jgi:hypothetical protein